MEDQDDEEQEQEEQEDEEDDDQQSDELPEEFMFDSVGVVMDEDLLVSAQKSGNQGKTGRAKNIIFRWGRLRRRRRRRRPSDRPRSADPAAFAAREERGPH